MRSSLALAAYRHRKRSVKTCGSQHHADTVADDISVADLELEMRGVRLNIAVTDDGGINQATSDNFKHLHSRINLSKAAKECNRPNKSLLISHNYLTITSQLPHNFLTKNTRPQALIV